MSAGITIRGLDEFRASLGNLEQGLPQALRGALGASSELVLTDARRRVPTRSGAARGSLRVVLADHLATVVGGSGRVPYFGWLDFGGAVGRRRAVRRAYIGDGRYVYFAHQQVRARYGEILSGALSEAIAAAGLEAS